MLSKIWNVLVSPVVFVVVCLFWCLDLGVGSIMAFRKDPDFWMKMDSVPLSYWLHQIGPKEMPGSAWVYILVALTWIMAFSLLLCSIGWFVSRKARRRTMAEALLHFGFMLVFAGFVIGSGWGARAQNIVVRKGDTVKVEEVGIALKLNGVKVVKDQTGRPLETVSELDLLDSGGGLIKSGSARINHPLIHGSTVVYPQGGEERLVGVRISLAGLESVAVSEGRPAPLPDGRELRVRGVLQEGQTYARWAGPGAFVTLASPGGPDLAGAFFGENPLFQEGRLGNMDAKFGGQVVEAVAGFNVHRDPGVQLVLIGALILTLGTFWAMGAYIRRG